VRDRLGLQSGCVFAALIVWLALVPVRAQNTMVLRGQIVDETGALIPGAHVVLTSQPAGKETTAVTAANGEFTLLNLAPGRYTLVVTADGFEPYLTSELRLPLAHPLLKIVLKVAAVSIETEVKADEAGVSLEPDQNLNATVLGEEFIETLPDNEEDLRDYLLALAGPAAGAQGGAQIYLNGFRGGRLPPREAILQIRINQNPFAAEYERPGAGRIEILTKPGNNEWHGGAGVQFRNSALDARNAFALVKPELDQKRYSFHLSGPLIRKRLSFFANVERRRLEGSGVVRAETLNGSFIANVPTPNTNNHFSLRTDYLLNQRNTLSLTYARSAGRTLNREFAGRAQSGGVSNYTLPERASSSDDSNHSLQLSETWLINPKLVHEARLRLQYSQRRALANTDGYAINVLDAFYGGGASCCPNSAREFSAEWHQYLTFTRNQHTLRGVVQLEYTDWHNFSASNFNGTFTFSSLDQYRRALSEPGATATQFTQALGNPRLHYKLLEASWFIQDDWRMSKTLTLSFGLRQELQTRLQDKLNFAPRVGLAWSPFKDRKTNFRAGGGMFYTRLTGGLYENTLRYDGVTQRSIVIRNPQFPDPFAGQPVITTGNTVRWLLAPGLQAPYIINFTGSIERQWTKALVSSLTYNFTRGVHQFRARNINAPQAALPGTTLNDRPDPAQGNLFQIESSAASVYHGLQFRFDRRLGRSFTAFTGYTLAWTRSDADGPTAFPANSYDLRAEWGRAASDRRHTAHFGGSLRLPYGWRVAPFINVYSGAPFNITTGRDENNDARLLDRLPGVGRNAGLPASLYASLPEPLATRCVQECRTGGRQINLLDFLRTNFPNGVRAEGPGFFSLNLSVNKVFGFGHRPMTSPASQRVNRKGEVRGGGNAKSGKLGGGKLGKAGKAGAVDAPASSNSEAPRFTLQLGAQITNLFNHVNFGQFSGVLTSPFFGRANSASTARQFELSVRFSF
jgi:hypothetical protein